MRARVRKDASMPAARKQIALVPWVIRAAATLPRGVQVTNPLLGEPITAAAYAVFDNAANPELSLEEVFILAKRAGGALLVWDADEHVRAAMHKNGFTAFTIDGCDQLFAANFELPSAPWLHTVELVKDDLSIGQGDPGYLQPDQKPKYRRTQTKDGVIVDSVTMLSKTARVIKDDEGTEERYVLGVVLEPEEVDSQGDIISAEEIRHAAYRYMEEHGNVGLQHQVFVNGKIKILESYIAPVDFTLGDELVKAGTWLMAFRVLDDSIWKAVKEGLLDGLSIGGTGLKIPVA